MVMIWTIRDPPYLVLECWLEIVNNNDLETITQAEIYESAKILQDLAKVKTTYTFGFDRLLSVNTANLIPFSANIVIQCRRIGWPSVMSSSTKQIHERHESTWSWNIQRTSNKYNPTT